MKRLICAMLALCLLLCGCAAAPAVTTAPAGAAEPTVPAGTTDPVETAAPGVDNDMIAIGNPLILSPDFPPLHTGHETFISSGVPSS